jgi:hypothetical protein
MRLPARLLLSGAALLVSASCVGDGSVAPVAPTIGGNPALRAYVVAQAVDLVIPAAGGELKVFDAFTLTVPANAVCDPNAEDTQVGYANAQWDAPCTPVTGDIAIRAVVKYNNGKLYVDFQPALRFAPDKNVILTTTVLASRIQMFEGAGITDGWSIQYSPTLDAAPVSDALIDATLRTKVHGSTGKISRRVKHFSGYVIFTDGVPVPCDPADGNPLCVWVDDEGHGNG